MNPTDDIRPQWKHLAEWWGATQAEHALVPGYELTAFDLAEDHVQGEPREIGWEVHGGPELNELAATGQAESFEEAKLRAEATWRLLLRGPAPP